MIPGLTSIREEQHPGAPGWSVSFTRPLKCVGEVPSQAGYLLSGLLEEHPGMKVVVAREVERFLFRPGLQERARYYGVIFLNQMPLSHAPSQGITQLAICP